MRHRVSWLVVAACAPAFPQERVAQLEPVEVVQRTPLAGEQPVATFPGHAQGASDAVMDRAGAGTLAEYMNRRLAGVTVNDVQGSPFQVDVNYRGHRLSPLLGTPQGLSVYLDGVRINQPFGDVMHWDLLPEAAIASMVLVPGSNPLYGLNTLGGSLALTTKSGHTHPGTEAEFSLGSGARRRLDVEHGQKWASGWHAFAAGTHFEEQGWRVRSPGRLDNAFFKVGREQPGMSWTASLFAGRSRLTGNGLTPEPLLAVDRRAGYTYADVTRNDEALLTLQGRHALSADDSLAAVAWLRSGRRRTTNGDVADAWADWLEGCEDTPKAAACTNPADPGYVTRTAVIHRGASSQSEAGVTLQWSAKRGTHQWDLGVEAAVNRTRHDQFELDAAFDATRRAQPIPGAVEVQDAALRGRASRFALFVADQVTLAPGTQLTASGRWNFSRVRNELGHPAPATGETFRYGKLNPSLGITRALTPALGVFASVSQSTRMPTALELACADASQPCVLPTGLQSDPYLKQVVARTVEAGWRTELPGRTRLTGAVFATVSQDDIVFVRSGTSQAGYFTNIDRTRRRGLELAAQGRQSTWDWQAAYTLLDATYQSSGVLPGPLSTASRPNVFVPGTPIAGLPRQTLKLAVDWRALPRLQLGLDWQVVGSQVVAGNEGGSRPRLGQLGGYALAHGRARWQVMDGVEFFTRVHNLTDRRYASFAAGNTDLFPAGRAVQPGEDLGSSRFVAPGAPRTIVAGLRLEFGP